MSKQTITVTVRDKQKIIFEGVVDAISSYNDKGIFDVLALHENYITLIRDKLVIHNNGEDKEFPIDGGIVKVNSNVVLVYLGLPSTEYVEEPERDIILEKLESLTKKFLTPKPK